LYRAIDERLIPAETRDGQGRRIEESIAEFSLVLATNYPGETQKALRNRTTPIAFEAYTKRELVEIGKRVATKLDLDVTAQALGLVADAAQGSPRNINRRLESLKLFAPGVAEYNLDDVRDLLKAEGFDRRNLAPPQRAYLRCVAGVPKQRAQLDHIAAKLGIDARFIRQEIEPHLIDGGYIVLLSNNARELTNGGRELMQELATEDCAV
jgi:Holliday junction resolvasome RuvABC ATP-dependent DNA helicase subunit